MMVTSYFRVLGVVGALAILFVAGFYTFAVFRSGQFYVSGELTATPFGVALPLAIGFFYFVRVAFTGRWDIWSEPDNTEHSKQE